MRKFAGRKEAEEDIEEVYLSLEEDLSVVKETRSE